MLCFEIKLLREIVRAFFIWRHSKKYLKNWPLPEIYRNGMIRAKRPIDDWRITNGIYQEAWRILAC